MLEKYVKRITLETWENRLSENIFVQNSKMSMDVAELEWMYWRKKEAPSWNLNLEMVIWECIYGKT